MTQLIMFTHHSHLVELAKSELGRTGFLFWTLALERFLTERFRTRSRAGAKTAEKLSRSQGVLSIRRLLQGLWAR